MKMKALSVLLAGCLCCTALPHIRISADALAGDITGDGAFDQADADLLQKWLLGIQDTVPADWQAADLNKDGVIDAADLSLMKQSLMALHIMTRADLLALAIKCDALTWADFSGFRGEDIGAERCVMQYPIADMAEECCLLVCGDTKEGRPDEILLLSEGDEPIDIRSEDFQLFLPWLTDTDDSETNRKTAWILGEYALAELQAGTYTAETEIYPEDAQELMREDMAWVFQNSAFSYLFFADEHTVLFGMPVLLQVTGYLVTDETRTYSAGDYVDVPDAGYDGDAVYIKWAGDHLYYFYTGL